jgi:small subunit ribosomal protein S8e
LFQTADEEAVLNKKRSKKVQKKYETRQKRAKVEQAIEEQFQTGRLLGEHYKLKRYLCSFF